MTIQSLRTIAPPALAIAEGATTPDPGIVGVSCWSTTLAKPVYWDGTIWSAGGSASVGLTASATPPSSPVNGQEWADFNTGIRYTWIDDGSSSAWVELGFDGIGGNGLPAGSDTQIQFNDGGAYAGGADLAWDKATNTLKLGGADTGVEMTGITNEPAAPAAGKLRIYPKSIAGRMMLKVKGPSGLDYSLQAAIWSNPSYIWTPTTATAGLWQNTAGAGAGTYSTALPTVTSIYTSIKRGRWANVVTTANQVLGQRNTEAVFFRGSVANQGGFFFHARCGFDVWTNGGRFFAGGHTGTTVISADPSALNNTVGFCVDAADNGAISFLTRGTAATKAATGLTITSGKGYDCTFFCAANSSQYTWRIVDLNTGTEASGTATTTLPTNTTMQTAGVLASNAALTTVTSIQLGVSKIVIETDN